MALFGVSVFIFLTKSSSLRIIIFSASLSLQNSLAMKANYQINAGDLTVIRPLIYCRESLMTAFAKQNNLPVINENCPACFEEPKERARYVNHLSFAHDNEFTKQYNIFIFFVSYLFQGEKAAITRRNTLSEYL